MKNYLIMVEGAHDIAVLEKILRFRGVKGKINNIGELPEVWKHTIPAKFPFKEGRLDRITPIPSFLYNQNMTVAIKNADGDKEIMPVLQQIIDTMMLGEKDQLDGVMLICDADNKTAEEKKSKLLSDYSEKSDFKIIVKTETVYLDIGIKTIPVSLFVFPDDEKTGNLENLLLEAAQVAYPELLELAEKFVEEASEIQKKLKKDQNAKKAKVGCITNAMKPGKANQVSIADDDWVSEATLRKCKMLKRLDEAVGKFIGE